MVIQNDIFKKYYNWIIIGAMIITSIIGYFLTNKNYYHSLLFYSNKEKTKLVSERRAIIKGKTKKDKIKNSIEELLLGPIDPKIYNIFPIESKLLSLRIENNTAHINLNRETIMNIDFKKTKDTSLYYLILQSIANTIHFQNRNIQYVKFYFDGKEYNFIGDIRHSVNGLKPDWKILK
ncbi:MAG: GerMN domain-containing protein [Spirochaetes bacterium]|nr:GerMN domain-containing protein [Spirochaetota bacterium]